MSPLTRHHCRFEIPVQDEPSVIGFVDRRPEDRAPTSFDELHRGVVQRGWRKLLFDLSGDGFTHRWLFRRASVFQFRLNEVRGVLVFHCDPSPAADELFRTARSDWGLLGLADLGLNGLEAAINELFGPVLPVSIAPGWKTETVSLLARRIRETGDFSLMPILADALQDAGCDSGAVLWHCREPGRHVQGCWCVDAILGTTD